MLEKLIVLLDKLDSFIEQCPPKGRSRFGDAGYRDWHAKLKQVLIHRKFSQLVNSYIVFLLGK